MNPTQNVQNQQTNSLQQPRSDLQAGAPDISSPNFTQDQLVAPQLRVGNSAVQPSGQSDQRTMPAPGDHSFALAWLLIPIVIAVVLFWPSRKSKSVEPEAIEVIPEPPIPVIAQKSKKKTKSKSTKRKKSKK